MRETKRATRMFSLGLILANFLFLALKGSRIIMHHQMIMNNRIYEATLRKIVLLDNMAGLLKYVIAMIAFLAILYLIEELFHATLTKDCSVLFMSMMVCLLLSLITVVFLQQPITMVQEHLDFLPYFLAALGMIGVINHIKRRIVHQMQRI